MPPTAVPRVASSCCTPAHDRAILMTATRSATSSKLPRNSPAAQSSVPMSTKGYRGHTAENPRRVFISGQKRGVFGTIKRELRRRPAIEPVIGHMKTDGHLGRCYLKGRTGDAANVILTAVGHNVRHVLTWLRLLLLIILPASSRVLARSIQLKWAS